MFETIRTLNLHLAIFLISVLAIQLSAPAESEAQDSAKSIKIANENIAKALQSAVNVDYIEAPWGEIQSEFEKLFKIKMTLDKSALNDGLSPDEPITANLTALKLRNFLALVLAEKNATFFVQNGKLVVCSLDEVERIRPKESDETRKANLKRDAEDHAKILKKLEHEFEIAYDEVPWSEVAKDLAKRLGVNILLHRSAKEDSLAADESISTSGKGKAHVVLKKVLAAYNATYVIENEVVLIVSLDSKKAMKAKNATD